MKRGLHRSDYFVRDFALQHRWYLKNAGEPVAARYVTTVQLALEQLLEQPGLGRRRNFRHPALQSVCAFQVRRPFDAYLIFYRYTDLDLFVERLMHGRRDLPHRLVENPGHPPD